MHDGRYAKNKEQEDARRKKMAQVLSIFMIRRNEKSVIRGQPVIMDYFKLCAEDIKSITAPTEEFQRRDSLFRERFKGDGRMNNRRNQWLRCLSYCERYIQWKKRKDKSSSEIWAGYTLEEASELIHARELIKELRATKEAGVGIVIFSQRTFLSEWVLMVRHPVLVI